MRNGQIDCIRTRFRNAFSGWLKPYAVVVMHLPVSCTNTVPHQHFSLLTIIYTGDHHVKRQATGKEVSNKASLHSIHFHSPKSTFTTRVPGTEWAYKYKFKNDLPDLPFDPKLLEYPFPVDRVYRYQHDELITSATLAISGRDNELGVPVAPFKSGWLQKALQTQVGMRFQVLLTASFD